MTQPRLAVLIDAENVSYKLADKVFELVAPLGAIRVRRMYGDFEGQAKSWKPAAARHALDARTCFEPTRGKNGSDMRLTIDAVDLLRDGETEGFCIVSSDGDFAELACRLRGDGRLAYGLGCKLTAQRYRDTCTQFFCLDPAPSVAAASQRTPHAALPLIQEALAKCQSRDGWYHLGGFGIEAIRVGLVSKQHGAPTLGKLMRATGHFTFKDNHWFQRRPIRAVASS